MSYYYIRKFLRWFCEFTKQQCSGKLKDGYANIWCQKRAFHDGPCVDYKGILFERPFEVRDKSL